MLPLSPKSKAASPAPELVSVQSEHWNSADADLIIRSTFQNPGYPLKKQPATIFRIKRERLVAASSVIASSLSESDAGILLRPFGDAPLLQVEEGCKTVDMMLRFVENKLADYPDLNNELFVDLVALFEAAAKYNIALLQCLCETVLIHRAPETPAKEALHLYCKAVALKRDEVGKAACKGIVKTKFSELPEDVLKTLPSEALIALVKSYVDK